MTDTTDMIEQANMRAHQPTLQILLLVPDKYSNGVVLVKRMIYPKWRLPGGFLFKGEALVDAAHRIAREELSVEFKNWNWFYPLEWLEPMHCIDMVMIPDVLGTDGVTVDQARDDVFKYRDFVAPHGEARWWREQPPAGERVEPHMLFLRKFNFLNPTDQRQGIATRDGGWR